MFEDELIPLCEEVGKIWDLRLMIDPASGLNKGYGFVTYCDPGESVKAVEKVRKPMHMTGRLHFSRSIS